MEGNSNLNIQVQESQPDLLYFFLSGDRLLNLYRILFTKTSINIPFHIYGKDDDMINTVEYRPIKYLAEYLHKIFDISIKVENSKLTYFGNEVMSKNKGDIDANGNKYQISLSDDYLPNGRIVCDSVKEVEGSDLDNLANALKIKNDITNCNVICRFFILPVDFYGDQATVYKNQFDEDRNNIKKIYIADDMMRVKNRDTNIYLLKEIFSQTDSSKRPEIILLPCLHENVINQDAIPDGELDSTYMMTSTNQCNNKGNIDPLCEKFYVNSLAESIKINTDIYTTFYGSDKVRKPNFFFNKNRDHCRNNTFIGIALKHYVNDAKTKNYTNTSIDNYANTDNYINTNNNIIRIEENDNTKGGRRKKKQTRKTRKPRKRSRKTRKHKKSRKH